MYQKSEGVGYTISHVTQYTRVKGIDLYVDLHVQSSNITQSVENHRPIIMFNLG